MQWCIYWHVAGHSVPHRCIRQIQLALRLGESLRTKSSSLDSNSMQDCAGPCSWHSRGAMVQEPAMPVSSRACRIAVCTVTWLQAAGSGVVTGPAGFWRAQHDNKCLCTSQKHDIAPVFVLQLRSMHDARTQDDIDAPLDVETTRDWKSQGKTCSAGH